MLVNYSRVYTSEQGCPINLVGQTGQAVQISIHSPSQYICANCERVLPDWKQQPFLWVVIVLQQSRCQLVKSTVEAEEEKEHLREKFMKFGCDLAFNLRDRGYLADLIDPRTGYPLLSHPGAIPHNDTAVVKALLKYPVIKNKCCVLVHPTWGTAVYPSILISEAPPIIIESVTKDIAPLHGWKEVSS
ncbi:methylmalonic aciduria and homocystinuria type D protein [Nostocaceae cyanobacterium CENA357]|uniref:Methylmalonic aciduria and homocystinuria type D protein n=1 Tax=Atlanticothrix silvestris CENA357 TaxID=1725252 RepID=A0A8J7HIH7_9CYAN|nr:methylmalonic aciduria and homocystinuria type D protein [Atlanticothrix silvestris]MBH8553161.1 methylmalonic aciduria and homocystinuria type D protein [Atlanticothrix silvestris CENA357]